MADYKKTKKNNNFGDNKCRVNIDTLSKARPMQVYLIIYNIIFY